MLRNLICSLPLLFIGGCGGHDHDHDHGDEAGHDEHAHDFESTMPGSTFVEIGAHKGQLEVQVDAEAGTFNFCVWTAHLEKGIKVKAETVTAELTVGDETFEVVCEAVENELKLNTKGSSHHFSGTDARLKGASDVEGKLPAVTINGVDYTDLAFSLTAE